ncbi:hypothetical protein SADUNF_Sadunf06G0029700 [Salix dunnii]|uniref:Uncharacterized protein n=1 Tax=Salix dunnii TaxID=1413687 RepID=A0A835MZV5_9ROSI|nr:hypothetical protein SADUNF_Sadunf06G0029700 [Salix dunnii]
MAGLQYYFFPTDFFYPRPPAADQESVSSPVQHIQPQKGDTKDRGSEQHRDMVRYKHDQSNLPQLSTSTALVPSPCIIKSSLAVLLILESFIFMAGLQYNFFPTDFYYPRPQAVKVDTAITTQKSSALPLQIQKRDVTITDDDKHHPTGLVIQNNKRGNEIGTPMNRRTA